MNDNSRLAFVFLLAAALTSATNTANAETLALDFQPTGGTTAPGFQAFEATNQVIPVAGTNYSAFGSTVNVSLTTANLPDGNLDFRAVTRNGTANILTNDWIGVDTSRRRHERYADREFHRFTRWIIQLAFNAP